MKLASDRSTAGQLNFHLLLTPYSPCSPEDVGEAPAKGAAMPFEGEIARGAANCCCWLCRSCLGRCSSHLKSAPLSIAAPAAQIQQGG